MASARGFAKAAFVAFSVLFLGTALWGWLWISWGAVRGEEVPSWAGPVAETSSALALAFFGVVIGLKETGWFRPRPQILVSLVRVPQKKAEGRTEDPWEVRAIVAVRPGARPLRVRTFTGIIEPLYEGAPMLRAPILLKPEPEPLDVAVKEFTYLVDHAPLPPEGKRHRLTFFLVADEGTTEAIVSAHHNGYSEPGWVQRQKDALWLWKQDRHRERGRKALLRGLR